MALITRLSRLFRSDLHAVLDRIEEPEVLLRQAIREMEEELSSDEQRIKLMTHEQGQIAGRLADLDLQLADIEEQLDVCFASNKVDLARALIRRKLEAGQLQKAMDKKRETLEEKLKTLSARLAENRLRLGGMRQKAELLAAEPQTEGAGYGWSAMEPGQYRVRDEDVEVALLREKQKRSRS
jgi:phage shock protein A